MLASPQAERVAMKPLKSAYLVVALFVATGLSCPVLAEYYKLEGVKRIEKDLYKSRAGDFIETRYCYHYAYGEDVVYNDSTKIIIWEDGDKCDVKRVFR
jgi:hypothetical protein